MTKRPANERFKSGDIVRYASGISALFRYEGTHNQGRLYGTHVMGGAHSASDAYFFDLCPASHSDLEFCKARHPDWFAADENRQSPAEAVSHEPLCLAAREAIRIADTFLPRAPMKRRKALALEIVNAISACERELTQEIQHHVKQLTKSQLPEGK